MPEPHERGTVTRDRATLRDIAAETGVSMSTVSQALRGTGRISIGTRERVFEAAERRGYRANVSALHMRGARTGLVGLVASLPDSATWSVGDLDFLVRCERAFSDAALTRDRYPVMLSGTSVVDAIGSLPVDGVAVIDPGRNDSLLRLLDAKGMPYATLGRDVSRTVPQPWVVDNDKVEITRRALDGLLDRGMQRALLVAADTGQNYMTDVVDAFNVWGSEHGQVDTTVAMLPLPLEAADVTSRVRNACADGIDTIYLAVEAALRTVLDSIVSAGFEVPVDVQVLTTTDSVTARTATPAISSVDLHPESLGERLLELLELRIGGVEPNTVHRLVPAGITWRASTRVADA
ncbi:MAG: LacI family DNA-binding transcriptional regulator [Pseudoclavibacter sp.]